MTTEFIVSELNLILNSPEGLIRGFRMQACGLVLNVPPTSVATLNKDSDMEASM